MSLRERLWGVGPTPWIWWACLVLALLGVGTSIGRFEWELALWQGIAAAWIGAALDWRRRAQDNSKGADQ